MQGAVSPAYRLSVTGGFVKKILLLILGFLTLGVGMIGVFLPILPTTPFVLIAAGCFSASSPAIYRRLENSPFFGEYINGIRDKRPISTKARVQGIVVLWVLLILSMLIVSRTHVTIILAVIGVCVTIHLLMIRRKVK
jgi:uncharacterized membrane protein YbaN (DUF454 family)